MAMERAEAETLAARILDWIAQDHERLGAFLAATGAEASDLRAAAQEPAMLGAVLDFLLADEDRLVWACAALGVPPGAPMRARAVLPGGDAPHWT